MEARDSSLGWAKRLEVSRRMRKRSGCIKIGVKALNYRPKIIENHLTGILKYDPTTLLTRFAEELRRADALLRLPCAGGGWFFTHVPHSRDALTRAKVAKGAKGFQILECENVRRWE